MIHAIMDKRDKRDNLFLSITQPSAIIALCTRSQSHAHLGQQARYAYDS